MSQAGGRRLLRRVGTTLIVLGAGLVIWALVTYLWQDPFTGTYTSFQQRRLADEYENRIRSFWEQDPRDDMVDPEQTSGETSQDDRRGGPRLAVVAK